MSTTILRTVDAWWVDTCVGAARIQTDATSLRELLEEPEKIHAARSGRQTVDPATLTLMSPVTAPCRVVAQMTNYASHVKDAGLKPDTIPLTFFRKTSGSISGPYDDIVCPDHVHFLDYEVEVGVVIGRELPVGTQVTPDNWASFVAGLVVTNDISARDVQLPKTQFFESKSYPTFTPVGPALVLLDENELKRFGDLRLRLWVNGEIRQDALVDPDMIFSPLQALAALSRFQRLDPGDLLLTGTPVGTALSAPAKPAQIVAALLPAETKWKLFFKRQAQNPKYLKDGDVVEVTIGTDDGAIDLGRQRTIVRGEVMSEPRRANHQHHAGNPRGTSGEPASDLLWPVFDGPADLASIEAVPLADRGLPATTYDLLRRAAALWPDRLALSVLPDASRFEHPTERTFAGLLADVHAYANVFHAHGVRRGDAVALLAPNCDELVTATLAAELAGIAAPVNSGLTKETVHELLARSGARVLVAADPELAPDVFATARDLAAAGDLDALLVLKPTTGGPAPDPLPAVDGVHVGYLATAAEGQPSDAFIGDLPSAADAAALFHTGGTTGTPKLAAHTHANEISDAWMLATSSLFRNHETVLFAALPLFHVNALVVTLLAPLFNGHLVVWAGPQGYRDPALYVNFWKLVERYRLTAMSAVPTVYAALAGSPVDADISSLRVAFVGASPLPPAVRNSFESTTGIALVEGYGLTEATCVSALGFPGHSRPGAVGQRLPYVQMKVVEVDAFGQWADLEPGQVGTLAIKGPAVFPGYVTGRGPNGPLLDGLGKVRDGWLDTGDLVRLDDDTVFLVGRAKDLIIRGGHNIDPAVIENTLLTHPAVTGAQAIGRPDIHSGEVPVAFVTLAPGAGTTSQELRDWARDHVPEPAASPKAVTILDALPMTHVGKAFKPALRAMAAGEAVAEALRSVPGVTGVRGVVENGAVVAVVGLADGADDTPVKETLDRFSISWRTELDKSTEVDR